ncbi:MAG TPA: hypothetical protein VLJ42_07680 [Solirubrobacteraceae bacterium]|nr:hypothetical protein [Solirubrobacteraceae bacterium]
MRTATALLASALLLSALLSLLTASRASAALFPASVIDGPSSAIVDVDGVAMAPDGTGGVVYRKVLGSQAHVFVARFAHGSWQPPIQADAGQAFAASSPTIAAGNGGRLLVVWAEPYATINQSTHYELMSAALDPGSDGFGQAIQIDPKDIGDGTAAFPSLSMAPNGQAYVAYRVVADSQTLTPLRLGDEQLDVRVARFNGLTWSSLGAVNRSPLVTMRRPTAENAPAIVINRVGTEAVVAWQEPDLGGVARIWARRLFGATPGNVLQVSPDTASGQPISVDADAPSIAVSSFNEAKVAYRLQGGAGSPFGGPHIFLNTLPSSVGQNASQFTGANPVDAAGSLGAPDVSIDDDGDFRLAYTAAGATRTILGSERSTGAPSTLGPASDEHALTTINPGGGGVSAWPASSAGQPVLVVREDLGGGAWQLAQLSAPASGPLDGFALGGSGMGDALIAFRQGPPGQSRVMGALAQAPPALFLLDTPSGWVKNSSAKVSWEPAPEAVGAPSYAVVVDGQVRLRNLRGLAARLSARGLGDGVHHIQVLATDTAGQQTMSRAANLKVDANPPSVSVRQFGGQRVLVRVLDRASGVNARLTSIALGDGTSVRRKLTARHRYAHAGRYVITVRSRDKVGHSGVAHIRVSVR